MKENKVTLWLFNFLHKTRIKERTETFSSGRDIKIYTPQHRSFMPLILSFDWVNIMWRPEIYDEVGSDMLQVAKVHIDRWLESKRKEFFTTTKVKYIKYP